MDNCGYVYIYIFMYMDYVKPIAATYCETYMHDLLRCKMTCRMVY